MRPPVFFVCCLLGLALSSAPVVAQVDYHKAQQAGRVWQKKQDENNRRDANANARADRTNSEGVAYDAPLSEADLQRTLQVRQRRESYDRLTRSVGRKNADQWLEKIARIDRSKR